MKHIMETLILVLTMLICTIMSIKYTDDTFKELTAYSKAEHIKLIEQSKQLFKTFESSQHDLIQNILATNKFNNVKK